MDTYNIGNQKVKVLETDSVIKIFIYGTNELKDLPVSIKCWKDINGFHAGAYEAAEELYFFLRDNTAISRSNEIHIGGHSMGGSIAECLGVMVDADKVITFGQFPVNSWQNEVTRYRKGFDLVTYLFPWFRNNKYVKVKGTMNPFKDHQHYSFGKFWEA